MVAVAGLPQHGQQERADLVLGAGVRLRGQVGPDRAGENRLDDLKIGRPIVSAMIRTRSIWVSDCGPVSTYASPAR
jgi:hypothetical protein